MKKMSKRVLALALALMMVLSGISPVSAYAQEAEPMSEWESTIENARELTLDNEVTATVEAEGKVCYAFTPTKTTGYDFSFSNYGEWAHNIRILDAAQHDIYFSANLAEDESWDYIIALKEGKTYYLEVTSYTGAEGSCGIIVSEYTDEEYVLPLECGAIFGTYNENGVLEVVDTESYNVTGYNWYRCFNSEEEYSRELIKYTTENACEITFNGIKPDCYECAFVTGTGEEAREITSVQFWPMIETGLQVDKESEDIRSTYGDTVTLSVNVESAVGQYEYTWSRWNEETSTDDPIDWSTDDYTFTAGVGKGGNYTCWVSDGYKEVSKMFYVSVETGLVVETDEWNPTVELGKTIDLTVNATTTVEGIEIRYQWYYLGLTQDEEGNPMEDYLPVEENGNSASYAVTGAENMPTRYRCEVSDGCGTTTDVDIEVWLDTGLVAEADGNEEHITVEYGKPTVLTVNASGGMGNLNYEWQYFDTSIPEGEEYPRYEYVDINGATLSTYEVNGNENMPSEFRCKVSDDYTYKWVYFYLTLDTGLTLDTDYRTIKLGYDETKTLNTGAVGGAGALTYQWYYGGEVETEYGVDWDWIEISGATTANYVISRVILETLCEGGTNQLKCVVSDGVTTKECEYDITIDSGLQVMAVSPQEMIVLQSAPMTFEVQATGGTGSYSYQWYKYALMFIEEEDEYYMDWLQIDGVTEASLYVDGASVDVEGYRCEVRDGITTQSVDFKVSAVEAREMPSEGGNFNLELSQSVPIWYRVQLEETSAYRIYSYENESIDSVVKIYNEQFEELFKSDDANGTLHFDGTFVFKKDTIYYIQMYSLNGSGNIAVGINPFINLAVSVDGSEQVVIPYGDTADLKVIAMNGVGDLKYQWYYYNDDTETQIPINGANTDTLSLKADENLKRMYSCIVSDDVTEVSCFIYPTIDTGLKLHGDYEHVEMAYGENTVLSVTTSGGAGNLTYTWSKAVYVGDEQEGGVRDVIITGATGSTYDLYADANASETYFCEITDGYMTVRKQFHIDYVGTIRELEEVADISLSQTSMVYTGAELRPEPIVKDGNITLEKGTHYIVEWANNVNAGTGTVTVKGIGKYKGTVQKTFTITAASISGAKVTASNVTYTGAAQKPSVTVTLGGKTLKLNQDYTIAGYSNNTNAGTATVTIAGKGNYVGEATGTFTINAASINGATITVTPASYSYDGTAKVPAVTVKVGNVTLKAGTDYTVAVSNNTNKGVATVVVTAIGNYTGTKSATFAINATSVANAKVTVKDVSYKGKAVKPAVTVKIGNVTLKEGTDYTVKYSNNSKIGTAKVTITGNGNYTGTKTATFKVKKGATVTVGSYTYEITGNDTVAFTGVVKSKEKKTTTVKVADTVKINGKKFKVTSIANKALYKNTKVKTVKMGKYVTTIGTSAFEGCTKLSSVTIGSAVTKIGDKAFKKCTALKKITIPAKVKTIGKEAFSGAKNLKTITVKSTKIKTVGKNAFKSINKKATIKVPSKKVSAYKKTFKNGGQAKTVKIKK